MSPRGGEQDGALTPLGHGLTLARCEACDRVLPEAVPPGLARLLVDALGETTEGLTATELAKHISRRRTVVEDELDRLRAHGIAERVNGRRNPRGWNARPWRLRKVAGQDEDKRQSASEANNDPLPLLPFFVAVSAAGAAAHRRAQLAFLGAAALFLLALLSELIAQAMSARRAA